MIQDKIFLKKKFSIIWVFCFFFLTNGYVNDGEEIYRIQTSNKHDLLSHMTRPVNGVYGGWGWGGD